MQLPIDFSINGPEKLYPNPMKHSLPFLMPGFSRFLSAAISEQKLPKFLGNISNPNMWRHFPNYFQYDQKPSYNARMHDQIPAKSFTSRQNGFSMRSSTTFSPTNTFPAKSSYKSQPVQPSPLVPSNGTLPSLSTSKSCSNSFENWIQSTKTKDDMDLLFCRSSVSMMHLQKGVKKKLDDVTEFDLWHCSKENGQFVPQWSQVVNISHLSEENKIEITFLTNSKQIVYQTELQRPFFVKNVGWCSLFPTLTQKFYGIQCSLMGIGQSCLTLSRKRKQQAKPAAASLLAAAAATAAPSASALHPPPPDSCNHNSPANYKRSRASIRSHL